MSLIGCLAFFGAKDKESAVVGTVKMLGKGVVSSDGSLLSCMQQSVLRAKRLDKAITHVNSVTSWYSKMQVADMT